MLIILCLVVGHMESAHVFGRFRTFLLDWFALPEVNLFALFNRADAVKVLTFLRKLQCLTAKNRILLLSFRILLHKVNDRNLIIQVSFVLV